MSRKQPTPPPAGAAKPDPNEPFDEDCRDCGGKGCKECGGRGSFTWYPVPEPDSAPKKAASPEAESPEAESPSGPIDCKSAEGINIGLIDALLTIAQILADRLRGQPVTDSEREALTDLRSDRDLAYIMNTEPARPLTCGDSGVFARLDSFRDLAAGWNSYGAQPIDPRAIAKAQELLRSLTVVPTARGGVQIEANAEGVEFEVEIGPDGREVIDQELEP